MDLIIRKIYKRRAWLLDDGVLLEGYTAKRKFYPEFSCLCGFSYQKIRKKDIGKILFYDIQQVINLI